MESHTLIGNLTRDPELRFTNDGTAVAALRIACNRRYQRDGEWQQAVTYFDTEVWKAQAEHVAERLGKGDRVIAVGRFRNESWETTEGEKRTALRFVATEIGSSIRFNGTQTDNT